MYIIIFHFLYKNILTFTFYQFFNPIWIKSIKEVLQLFLFCYITIIIENHIFHTLDLFSVLVSKADKSLKYNLSPSRIMSAIGTHFIKEALFNISFSSCVNLIEIVVLLLLLFLKTIFSPFFKINFESLLDKIFIAMLR